MVLYLSKYSLKLCVDQVCLFLFFYVWEGILIGGFLVEVFLSLLLLGTIFLKHIERIPFSIRILAEECVIHIICSFLSLLFANNNRRLQRNVISSHWISILPRGNILITHWGRVVCTQISWSRHLWSPRCSINYTAIFYLFYNEIKMISQTGKKVK